MKTIVKRPSSIPSPAIGSGTSEKTAASAKVEFVELLLAQERRIQRLEKVILELRSERDELLEREAKQASIGDTTKASSKEDEIVHEELPEIDASEFQPMVDYVPHSPIKEAIDRLKEVARLMFDKSKMAGMYLVKKIVSILTW